MEWMYAVCWCNVVDGQCCSLTQETTLRCVQRNSGELCYLVMSSRRVEWSWLHCHATLLKTTTAGARYQAHLTILFHSLADCNYQPPCMFCSSTQDLLTVPHCRTAVGGHRFSVVAPQVWNSLPKEIINCETVATFKKNLEASLFCHYAN